MTLLYSLSCGKNGRVIVWDQSMCQQDADIGVITYSVVSCTGCLHVNITCDFGLHGRLPGIYVCIEAATVAP